MSTLIITVNSDNSLFDVGNSSKIYIFDNVKEYHDELCDIIADNKLSYEEIQNLVKSWGGTIDLVDLSTLVKNYKKNHDKGLPF
mgnify:CR=1 FL=1